MSKKRHHKKLIRSFLNEMNSDNSQKVISKYFSDDVLVNITRPFEEIKGSTKFINEFWKPFFNAFPAVENQPYILMAGDYENKNYVSCTGNFIGTFNNDWLSIPATNQPIWLRYTTLFRVENNKIIKAWYFFDILDIMRQAGFNFFPNRGIERVPPAPMTRDGILNYETDSTEGQQTLDLINAMLEGLGNYDGKTVDSMKQERFWDTKNMMWYGPGGIGTTRGLKGFQNNHQIPFLKAFPTRGMLPKTQEDQFCQLGDANYAFDFGFPLMYGTHLGNDWLGLSATGKKITMRVLDFWRRENDTVKENWVMIDMIDILNQLGIDVFEMLKTEVQKRNNKRC
ncbi:MAG: ester cyclase [Polaribacter sp.]